MKYSSIVDYMNSLGVDSSYQSRKELFSQVFGEGYSGSSSQNIKLMNFIQQNYKKDYPTLFDNPSIYYPGQSKVGKIKEYMGLVKQLAMISPNDPMLPQYQQFIRKQIGSLEEQNSSLAKMIK